jgi:beta-1,4-N-acetylglucosaminyltransferase
MMTNNTSRKKICLVTSSGGHIFQLARFIPAFIDNDYFWVTFNKPDILSYTQKRKTYFAHYPETRNFLNAVRNLFFAFRVIAKEKPDVIVSCGAGVAVPFFLVAKLFSIHTIFIEPVDFIYKPSWTGKILYPIADLFLVQSKIQKKFYPKAQYWGSTL